MLEEVVQRYRTWKSKQDTREAVSFEKDHLGWNEKIPLGLALAAQSYVLFNWYLATVKGIHDIADFVIAIAAGIALDLIVVTTTMGRREGRESNWSHAAAFGAFVCSALIALKVYGAIPWLPEGWLHIAFPLEVWLYSQHLATPKRTHQRAMVANSAMMSESEALSLPAQEPVLSTLLSDLKAASSPMPANSSQPTSKPRKTVKKAAGGPTKRSRVRATLDEHGNLKDSELYELLPDIGQSSVRVHASEWRKEQLMATNGKH